MDTVTLVLACYRNPLAHQNLWSLTAPLPEGMGLVLGLANESPEVLDRAVRQTGVKAYELRDAARFCIQQWCLARGADVHRVLGVEPGAPLEQIKEHYRQLIRLFHPDRAAGRETWTEDYASRINEAWMILSRTADTSKLPASPPADAGLAPEMVHPAVESAPERVPPPTIRPQRQSVPATRRPWPLSRMVLIGLLLALSIGWSGFHADRLFSQHHEFRPVLAVDEPALHPEKLATAGVAPKANEGVFAVLLAAPDWQALEQRERQVQQQVVQAQAARQQWEEKRRQQIADETAMLEKTHAARVRLEQQLKSEQLRVEQVETVRQETERQSLARLQAEQARLEKLKREREQAERQHLAVFEAEHLKAERLAEELRIERQRLEKLKAEQVQA
ncbi:MAG: DnaJ domain-containing protein, partial [Candidatus Contendobacter sp.]